MDELLLAMQDVAPPSRAQTQDVPVTEAVVPVVAPPPVAEPHALAQPPRSPSWLLVGGFFVAAVTGVLGTWALVKPATPTRLTFHVESSPSGANVFVDGKLLGVTPIELEQGLANGRAGLELRLEKDGFAATTTRLSANGGRLEFAQTLTPLSRTAPPAAEAPGVKAEARPPEPKVEKVERPRPEPTVERLEKAEKPRPEPKVEKLEKAARAEPRSKVEARAEPRAEPPPAAGNDIDKAFDEKPARGGSAKKKAAVKGAPESGPRPASKLDEDDAPQPPTELKRPAPN
jgi:hypothetical protein